MENIRQNFVEGGFERALERKQRETPPRPKILDGEAEARVIALRQGDPPKGYANWSLRLLAGKVVELGIVDSISYETVRQTLKKRLLLQKESPALGDSARRRCGVRRAHGTSA